LIHFSCENCGKKYQLPDTSAGGKFSCDNCNYVMFVPEPHSNNGKILQFRGRRGSKNEISIWIKNWVESKVESITTQDQFEDFIVSIIEEMGYQIERIPEDERNGIDFIATGSDKKIAIQIRCKPYNKKVTDSEVSLLVNRMYKYDTSSAIIITNRDFESSLYSSYSQVPISFWNRQEIIKLVTKLTFYSKETLSQQDVEEFWCELGGSLLAIGRYVEALDCFDFVLSINPVSAKTCLYRAMCYEKLGNLKEALLSASNAVKSNANFSKYITFNVDIDYFHKRLAKRKLEIEREDVDKVSEETYASNDKGPSQYVSIKMNKLERNYVVRDWDNNKLSFVKVDMELENLNEQTIEFSLMDTQFYLVDERDRQYPHINPIDINSFQRKNDILHKNNFKILGNGKISGQVLFADIEDDARLKRLVLVTELFVGTNNFTFCHDETAVDIRNFGVSKVNNLSR